MPKQTETPAAPIRLSCNTILDGRFINAGDPLPVERGAALPEVLRPLAVTGEPEPEEPNEAGGFFDLNTPLSSDRRQSTRPQGATSNIRDGSGGPRTRMDRGTNGCAFAPANRGNLATGTSVTRRLQAAQAAALARAADAVADAAAAASAPRPLYVKRGSRHYVEIHRTKLRPAEPVSVKDADGAYESIGITDSRCEPPTPQ